MNIQDSRVETDPDLHDGRLIGIELGADSLRLHCTHVDGRNFVCTLTHLKRLRAENFLEGNIIFEIVIYRGEVPRPLLRKLFGLTDSEPEPSWLAGQLAALSNPMMMELTSSYGCELLALADGQFAVELSESTGRN